VSVGVFLIAQTRYRKIKPGMARVKRASRQGSDPPRRRPERRCDVAGRRRPCSPPRRRGPPSARARRPRATRARDRVGHHAKRVAREEVGENRGEESPRRQSSPREMRGDGHAPRADPAIEQAGRERCRLHHRGRGSTLAGVAMLGAHLQHDEDEDHRGERAKPGASRSCRALSSCRCSQTSCRFPDITLSRCRASEISTSSRHADNFIASTCAVAGLRTSIPADLKTTGPELRPIK